MDAKMKKRNFLIGLLVLIVLISGCISNIKDIPPEKYCEKNSDCVPNKCCHPNKVINKKFAPNCEGTICTTVCSSILDCREWKAICKNNACEVKFYD